MAPLFWFTIFLICNLAFVQWASADPWSGRRLYAGDAYVNGDFSASKFFGEVSSATVADASNQIPQDDLEYILSELWYKTGIAYNQRYRWDGGAAGLDAVLGRQSLGLGTAALRNAEDTLTNGENLPDGAAIINYINGRGFITDPNDSVQPSELDGTFSTIGLLKRLGAASYTTVPDNSANWDTAYDERRQWDGGPTNLDAATGRTSLGLGSAATRNAEDTLTNGSNLPDGAAIISYINGRGFITDPNDSVQPSELDGTFSTVGLLKRLGAGSYTTVPDNSANWDQAFGWGNHATQGYLKTYNPNDSVDASELEVLFGPLGAGLMIHSASGQFNVTPDNHANWDTAYTDRMKWDGGATGLNASTGRTSLGLGTAATRNAEDTLTNGSNLPSGGAVIAYVNGRGFMTDPNDSVQGSELDGVFSTVGLLKRTGTAAYTTVPDNSANWNTAYTDRLKWDGGSTNLDAPTGRNSLGLGSASLSLATDFATSTHNHGTGTTGKIPKYTTTTGFGDSIITESGEKIGFGVTTPPSKVSILGANGLTTNDLIFSYDSTGNYRNGISNTFSSTTPSDNTMNFLIGNKTTTGQVNSLRLRGDGSAYFPGNVGIKVLPSTVFPLHVAGGIFGNTISSGNSSRVVTHRNVLNIMHSANPDTSALVINLPDAGNTVLVIKITGFDYVNDASFWEATIGAYWYSSGKNWLIGGVDIKGPAPFKRIRLMKEGTLPRIVLGETNTVWRYPEIKVDIEIAGWLKQTAWATGWTHLFTTDLSAYKAVMEPLVKSYTDATGKHGIKTTTPEYDLDVNGTVRANKVYFPDAYGDKLFLKSNLYGVNVDVNEFNLFSDRYFTMSSDTNTDAFIFDADTGSLTSEGNIIINGIYYGDGSGLNYVDADTLEGRSGNDFVERIGDSMYGDLDMTTAKVIFDVSPDIKISFGNPYRIETRSNTLVFRTDNKFLFENGSGFPVLEMNHSEDEIIAYTNLNLSSKNINDVNKAKVNSIVFRTARTEATASQLLAALEDGEMVLWKPSGGPLALAVKYGTNDLRWQNLITAAGAEDWPDDVHALGIEYNGTVYRAQVHTGY